MVRFAEHILLSVLVAYPVLTLVEYMIHRHLMHRPTTEMKALPPSPASRNEFQHCVFDVGLVPWNDGGDDRRGPQRDRDEYVARSPRVS
jgi:hypothetical protein